MRSLIIIEDIDILLRRYISTAWVWVCLVGCCSTHHPDESVWVIIVVKRLLTYGASPQQQNSKYLYFFPLPFLTAHNFSCSVFPKHLFSPSWWILCTHYYPFWNRKRAWVNVNCAFITFQNHFAICVSNRIIFSPRAGKNRIN